MLFVRRMATTSYPGSYPSAGIPVGSGTARDTELDRVRTLARVLDGYFVDPLIGLLLPGAGDLIGSMLGIYTVVIAARRKVSHVVIARMLMNLAGDAIIGFIPLVGDLFDFGFRANQRNVNLLSDRVGEGGRATARDWAIVIGAGLAYLVVMTFVIWGIIAIVRAIM